MGVVGLLCMHIRCARSPRTLVPSSVAPLGHSRACVHQHAARLCRSRGGYSYYAHSDSGVLKHTKTAYRDIALFPVGHIEYPYPISTVFSAAPDPSQMLPLYRPSLIVGTLTYLDYRYNRFTLDPRTGLFSMIRSVQIIAGIGYSRAHQIFRVQRLERPLMAKHR